MSEIIGLLNTIDFCCPHCDEYNEIDDIDISVTVDNKDIMRQVDECVFEHECEHCHGRFRITPHMNIGVEKVN